jgi:hypothetical protein
MNNKFDDKLKKIVGQLPEYKANPDSWTAIEQYLDFSDRLSKVKNDLPAYKAPDIVWAKPEYAPGNRQKDSLQIILKIAAAVLFLTGSWFIFQTFSNRRLSYSIEVATDFNPEFALPEDSMVVQVTEFIDQQCKSNTYVCNEPDFSVKKKKLDEVTNEIEKLDEVIKTLGSSESLVKTRISLENYKTELIKDLIKKLTS